MGATLHSRIPQKIAEVQARVSQVVELVGQGIDDTATEHARRLTGAMQIGLEWEKTGPTSGRVTATDWKSHFHEFGTTKMSAQPMLTPAAEEWRKPFERLVARAVK